MNNINICSLIDERTGTNVTPEPEFSGLYSYHISTNTWCCLRTDANNPRASHAEIRSRIGHSMLFHAVSWHLQKENLHYCIVQNLSFANKKNKLNCIRYKVQTVALNEIFNESIFILSKIMLKDLSNYGSPC